MGNRAVIAFETGSSQPCIYLHWNGGRASIEAFLKFAQETGIGKLPLYSAIDMLARSIALWMEVEVNKTTVYIEPYGRADKNNGDNGVYLVNHERMEINGRTHLPQSSPKRSAIPRPIRFTPKCWRTNRRCST